MAKHDQPEITMRQGQQSYLLKPSTSTFQQEQFQFTILNSDDEKEELKDNMKEYGTFETDRFEKIICSAIPNFGIGFKARYYTANQVWYKVSWK